MPLQPQTIDFPLAQGLDSKTAAKLTRGLLKVENGVIEKTGAVKKRPGFRKLASKTVAAPGLSTQGSATLEEGYALYDFRGSPVVFGRSSFKNTSGLENMASGWRYHMYEGGLWRPVGEAAPIGFEYKTLVPSAADGSRFTYTAVGLSQKHIACVYYDAVATVVYIAVFTLDGALVAKKSVGTLAALTGLFVAGFRDSDNFTVIYADGDDIYVYVWNPTSDAASGPTVRGHVNSVNDETWSACYARDSGGLSGSPDAVILLDDNAATTRARLQWFTAGSTTVQRTVNAAATNVPHQPAEVYCPPRLAANLTTDPYVRVLYLRNSESFFRFEEYTADGQTSITGKALTAGVDPIRLGELPLPWGSTNEKFSLISLAGVYETVSTTDENALGNSVREGNNFLIPRMFTLGGQLYSPVYEDNGILATQNTLFIRSLRRTLDSSITTQSYVAGILLPSEGGSLESGLLPDAFCGSPIYFTDGRVGVPARRESRLPITASLSWFCQEAGLIIFEHKPPPPSFVRVGEGLILAGSITGWFDGRFQELGFHLFPEQPGSITAGAGGALATATYSFRVTWQWNDALGNEFRSAASSARTVSASANDKATWAQDASPFAHPNRKRSTTRIVSYRTIGGGSTHFEEGAVDDSTTQPDLMPTDAQATTTVRGGVISDANLVSNPVLPLDALEVEPTATPGSKLVFARRDRAFLVPMDHQTRLWVSKPLEKGRGPEFSADLVLVFEEGGNINAGICQDDSIVLWKDASIYVFGGEGPNALGQGAFTPPRKLATDTGASNQNGVVGTRLGAIFKSQKGWYLLDRSLQVDEKIGLPVAGYNDREVLASLLLEDRDTVAILVSGGVLLTFDLTHKLWQTHPLPREFVHAALVGGVLHFLAGDGSVWKEDQEAQTDDGEPYSMVLGSPWFKTSPLPESRLWRIGILGELGDKNFRLKVSIYYDYNDTEAEQVVFLDTAEAELDESGSLILEVVPARTRCQSFRLQIEDVDGEGANFALLSLTLDMGVAKRLGRQRPSRRA